MNTRPFGIVWIAGLLLAGPATTLASAASAPGEGAPIAPVALLAQVMQGVCGEAVADEFAREASLSTRRGSAGTLLAERAGVRVVLFQGAEGRLVRADLYFAPASAPPRAELEAAAGAMSVYQRSKDSRLRAERADCSSRGATLFATILGARADAADRVTSFSIRLH
jgi:hypothetical protein